MKKLINIIIFFAFFFGTANAADITDEISNEINTDSNSTRLQMPINLKNTQKAFKKSDQNANTKNYTYAKDKTYKIRLREYMTTTVVLPEPETIFSYALGDSNNFSFSLIENRQKNIFTVSPVYPGADTNLLIFGKSGNIYSFYLFADSVKSKLVPDLVVYIKDPILKIKKENAGQKKEKKQEQAKTNNDYLKEIPTPDKRNYDYYIKGGDVALAPVKIFDDGYFTFFKFGKNLNKTKLPVIYQVIDGYDTPVNSRVRAGYIIAESINKKWTLRRGEAHLCVWNTDQKTNREKVAKWLKIMKSEQIKN
ncbi:MAG: TrbG/VirB9 family P-type conjugative transfer protein [Deltaproteobacteria bacterium]|nr:TrbG/VirB9 family P-type conjugative transfer protein [Deltaproteobacteria bacterium]